MTHTGAPERLTVNGTSSPKTEPKAPFDPETDQVSQWKTWVMPSYRTWVEEGLRVHGDKLADILEYNTLLGDALLAEGNVYLRSAAAQAKGGGGKSPLIASTASAAADCSKRNTLIIDNNQAMGNVAKFLGIPRDGGMTTRECAELTKQGELKNAADFSVRIPSSRYGVMLLVSDKVVKQNDLYGRDTAMTNMQVSQQHFPLIFNDTGNGVQDPATGGVWDMLNVLMFPSLTRETHIEASLETRDLIYSWRSDSNNYASLVENGIQVVVGIKPGETLESYREKLELTDDRLLFAQPYDPRMAEDKPVNFMLSSLYYQIACREIALVNLRIARRSTMTAQDRLGLKTGRLVQLESGRTPVLPWIDGSLPVNLEKKGA